MSRKLLKLAALLLTVALIFSFAACGTKGGDAVETPKDTGTVENVSENKNDAAAPDAPEDAAEDPDDGSVDDPAAPDEEAPAIEGNGEGVTEDGAPADPVDGNKGGNAGDSPDETSTTKKETDKLPFDPNNPNSTLNFYKMMTAKAEAPKTGFTKTRVGKFTEKPDIGKIKSLLSKNINPMELISKFMSIGDYEYSPDPQYQKGVEGKYGHKALQASTLTMSDVKSVSCKINGDIATITIELKDGSTDENTDFSKLPLDKSGICSGKTLNPKTGKISGDYSYYDHKNAQSMNDAFSLLAYKEKYNNAKVVAKINFKTEQFTDLMITFHTEVDATITLSKVHAAGNITVKYTDFKY